MHFELAAILIACCYCFDRFDSEKESSRSQVSTLCDYYLDDIRFGNKILRLLNPKLGIRLKGH